LAGRLGQTGHFPNLFLVEGFRFQQGLGESFQLVSVLGQQTVGFTVTLLDDVADLSVDQSKQPQQY
jgi:hypothetical protein